MPVFFCPRRIDSQAFREIQKYKNTGAVVERNGICCARWQRSTLTERASAQSHFIDLCAVLNKPTPAEVDPTGERCTFEKSVLKTRGGKGFADVWFQGHFAWEYKGKKKNLEDAYDQLRQYEEALGNPPLLVVCDINRFEVHTRFNGLVKKVYAFGPKRATAANATTA